MREYLPFQALKPELTWGRLAVFVATPRQANDPFVSAGLHQSLNLDVQNIALLSPEDLQLTLRDREGELAANSSIKLNRSKALIDPDVNPGPQPKPS